MTWSPDPRVEIPYGVAALLHRHGLARWIAALADELRRDGYEVPSELYQVVEDCERARGYDNKVREGASRQEAVKQAAEVGESGVEVSSAMAAELLGLTTRAITKRCKKGHLEAYEGPQGRWVITDKLLVGPLNELEKDREFIRSIILAYPEGDHDPFPMPEPS